MEIKLIIADDHPLYLEGLNLILSNESSIKIINTATTGKETITMVNCNDVDVLLLDLHLPDLTGVEILEEIRKTKPNLKVIMLTHQKGSRYLNKLLKLNIKGYVLKNVSTEFLKNAIITIANGGECFSEDIKNTTIEEDTYLKSSVIIYDKQGSLLSEREKEILILVCSEMSSANIGKQLFLSTSTVDTHRKNILNKLGVTNTVGLVKYAIKHHII